MNKIKSKKEEIRELETRIAQLNNSIKTLEIEKDELENRNSSIKIFLDMGYEYIPYENQEGLELQKIEIQEKIIKSLSNGLFRISNQCVLNNSNKDGQKIQKVYGEGLTYAMNAYVNTKEKSVNVGNFSIYKKQIENKFNDYQKRANLVGIILNKEYIKLKISLLEVDAKIKAEKKFRLHQEKIEKEKLKEEQKLLMEAENERRKLKLEKEAMDLAFNKALTDEERQKIKIKLEGIDKRLKDIDYRINNQRAGYLYIIDSKSLPNMIKIGVTRRLNPAIRVKELSSSSLPFPFRLRAYCFCENAFDLESKMHEYFDSHRVSPQREFFYISPEAAIHVLKNNFNQKVQIGTIESEEDI